MIRERINKKIEDNYYIYKDIVMRFSNNYDCPEDILNETLLDILSLNDEKLEKIELFLDKYIVRILKLSFISKTSKYQQKYNKLLLKDEVEVNDLIKIDEEYDTTIDDRLYIIEDILKKHCSWFEAEVFREYLYTKKSFDKISKECDIPSVSLWKAYRKALLKIKNKI